MAMRARLLSLVLALWPLASQAQPVIEIPSGPPAVPAAEDPHFPRPDTAGRIVKVFTFEEAKSNPGEVPQNWYRSFDDPGAGRARPGFPSWNKAALSYTTEGGIAFGGVGSVLLPTRGGSTSLIVGQGVLPVFQNADYLISAKVKTDHLAHARAALAARFLDKAGAVIPRSESRSPLTIANDQWQDIRVELTGDFETAAYIQLELQLLQPEQYEPAPAPSAQSSLPSSHKIWSQDIAGAACFDDIAIVQLPRVELSTTTPCNIISAPDTPELRLLVRDLTGESLAISVTVLDTDGRPADQLARRIGAGFTSTTWKPRLP